MHGTPEQWSQAYLGQAYSDFTALEELAGCEGSANFHSQITMLLQMAWEKLAKAALVRGGSWDPDDLTHKVAAKLASMLTRSEAARNAFGYRTRHDAQRGFLALRDDLQQLERLCPALADRGENAEYPWAQRDPSMTVPVFVVRYPRADLHRNFSSATRAATRLRKDFQVLVKNFDRLFGE